MHPLASAASRLVVRRHRVGVMTVLGNDRDGMRDLLTTKDGSSITLTHVASAAGISRQTIYNEFGSRQGLAQGYAMRLAFSQHARGRASGGVFSCEFIFLPHIFLPIISFPRKR